LTPSFPRLQAEGYKARPPTRRALRVRFPDAIYHMRDNRCMDTPFKSNRNVTYRCTYHVVWRPKYRRKVLVPPIDARRKEIIAAVIDDLRQDLVEVEVMTDHVHLLVGCNPQCGIHRFAARVKGVSSRLPRQEYPPLKSRLPSLWTNSYDVATTGGAPLDQVKRYIENQKRSER